MLTVKLSTSSWLHTIHPSIRYVWGAGNSVPEGSEAVNHNKTTGQLWTSLSLMSPCPSRLSAALLIRTHRETLRAATTCGHAC